MGFEGELLVTTSILQRAFQRGLLDNLKLISRTILRHFFLLRGIFAEEYKSPSEDELELIQGELSRLNISIIDFQVGKSEFQLFKNFASFPADYHGGIKGGVYEEKLLEHFVAWSLLKLSGEKRYLDIAGASSPWTNILNREGIEAYSIDLVVPDQYSNHSYYVKGDATATHFPDNYFDAASAQCAYEMFEGASDMALLSEIYRILKPGGRFVISPLYMHIHSCYYQTPDYWKKPHGDAGAKAYIRRDCWGIPSSRKYSALTLRERVLDTAAKLGLEPTLHVLRNKREISSNIYLHFILVLDKPNSNSTS